MGKDIAERNIRVAFRSMNKGYGRRVTDRVALAPKQYSGILERLGVVDAPESMLTKPTIASWLSSHSL